MRLMIVVAANLVAPLIGVAVSLLALHPEILSGEMGGLSAWTGCLADLALRQDAAYCAGPAEFGWLGLASLAVAGFVAALLIVNRLAAVVFGSHRSLLALSFAPYTLLKLVAVTVVAMATVGLLAAAVTLAAHRWLDLDPSLLVGVLALAALSLAGGMIASGAVLFTPSKTYVAARPISLFEHPRLGLLLRDVAKKTKARMPDNVVLGLEPTFFATSAPVQTPYLKGPLRGQTLHLSLPLMNLFSVSELKAVVGHELAHFSGDDTLYSRRFAPALASLDTAMVRVRRGGGWISRILGAPARLLLEDFVELYGRIHGRMSRDRELRADRLGAQASSPNDIAYSLLKASVGGSIWRSTVERFIERAGKGRFSRNLVRTYADQVRFDVDRDKLPPFIEFALGESVSHPTDSHPPTEDRIARLGLDFNAVCERDAVLQRFFADDRAPAVLDNLTPIEEDLTVLYYHLTEDQWRPTAPEELEDKEIFVRLLVDFLARMVAIDGSVDDREIAVAERSAMRVFGEFDCEGFRERCRSPEDIPELSRMVGLANAMLTPKGAENLMSVLRAIAEADRKLDPAEAAMLKHMEEALRPQPVAAAA
jgi:Zn-dependent protease with chaperone function